MSLERKLASVLAVLVVIPILYRILAMLVEYDLPPAPIAVASLTITEVIRNIGGVISIFQVAYLVLMISVGLALLKITDSISVWYKFIWAPAIIFMPLISATGLILRVYQGRPVKIPKTVEEQRQILREKVREIRDGQDDI